MKNKVKELEMRLPKTVLFSVNKANENGQELFRVEYNGRPLASRPLGMRKMRYVCEAIYDAYYIGREENISYNETADMIFMLGEILCHIDHQLAGDSDGKRILLDLRKILMRVIRDPMLYIEHLYKTLLRIYHAKEKNEKIKLLKEAMKAISNGMHAL